MFCLIFSGGVIFILGLMSVMAVTENNTPFGKAASFWAGVMVTGIVLLALGLISKAIAHVRWQ